MHSLYQTTGGQSEYKFLVNKTYFRICFLLKFRPLSLLLLPSLTVDFHITSYSSPCCFLKFRYNMSDFVLMHIATRSPILASFAGTELTE